MNDDHDVLYLAARAVMMSSMERRWRQHAGRGAGKAAIAVASADPKRKCGDCERPAPERIVSLEVGFTGYQAAVDQAARA